MIANITEYFKSKKYQVHLFKLFGLNDKDFTTFKVVSHSKKRTSNIWYWNNLFFPIIVIFLPYSLTLLNYAFNTIEFNKTIQDICISGSLTLLGINVLRNSSTIVSERNNHQNVPADLAGHINEVELEITAMKKKLSTRSWVLSLIGMFFYFAQIGLFVKNDGFFVYIFILLVVLIFLISIQLGRFISILETNIFDTEDAIRLLFQKLVNGPETYNELQSQLKRQGLL